MSENVIVKSSSLTCRADIAGLALKQGHRLTACLACCGPIVHSRARQSARSLGCGSVFGERLTKCWTCGGSMKAPIVPPDLARRNTLGLAPLSALEKLHTCTGCGGEALGEVSVRRSSWRKCESCKRPLSGRRPVRGSDLCASCQQTRNRTRSRESSRARRDRNKAGSMHAF